jgi:hypothetical protein
MEEDGGVVGTKGLLFAVVWVECLEASICKMLCSW